MENRDRIICLVIADTHGDDSGLSRVLSYPNIDAVIFLGDGLLDVEGYAERDGGRHFWLAVKGNGDVTDTFLGCEVKKTDGITLGGKNIVFTHGHLYGVKYGNDMLRTLAEDTRADIVLYAHTHVYDENYYDGVYYFNPGTLGGAKSRPKTAGLLTIDRGNVLFSKIEL